MARKIKTLTGGAVKPPSEPINVNTAKGKFASKRAATRQMDRAVSDPAHKKIQARNRKFDGPTERAIAKHAKGPKVHDASREMNALADKKIVGA